MLSTRKSCLKVSLISLILIFSLTEVSQAHRHHAYHHDQGRKVADNPNWMSVLRDDLRLSDLSIPGTHETMSRFGTDYVKNQSLTLNLQLVSGIRVLDIRCAVVGNHFNIYHGNVFQNANFDDVLRTVVEFLRNHRGETVLMRVKEENTSRPAIFEQNFRQTYWNKDEYKNYFWKFTSENPTVREMRGKIVVLQDFARSQCDPPTPKPEFGLCYNSFSIQDHFALNGNVDLYDKWERVKKHLADANDLNTRENRDVKYMNYLSGATNSRNPFALGLPFPYFVVSGHSNPRTGAPRLFTNHVTTQRNFLPDFPRLNCAGRLCSIYFEGTNILTYGHLHPGWYDKRVGIIMTDFPGGGLIERIICINYPMTDPLCKRAYP